MAQTICFEEQTITSAAITNFGQATGDDNEVHNQVAHGSLLEFFLKKAADKVSQGKPCAQVNTHFRQLVPKDTRVWYAVESTSQQGKTLSAVVNLYTSDPRQQPTRSVVTSTFTYGPRITEIKALNGKAHPIDEERTRQIAIGLLSQPDQNAIDALAFGYASKELLEKGRQRMEGKDFFYKNHNIQFFEGPKLNVGDQIIIASDADNIDLKPIRGKDGVYIGEVNVEATRPEGQLVYKAQLKIAFVPKGTLLRA